MYSNLYPNRILGKSHSKIKCSPKEFSYNTKKTKKLKD